jgi:ACS family hexuronate transporter-like MFS transporter
MMLVSMVSYIDRNTLALLIPTIMRDTGLTAEEYGWIVSAFSVAYMIGNPVWGGWLDRLGVRRGMLAAVALWSVASAAHAGVSTLAGFAVARTVLGFGEGATFPGALRTVVQTLDVARRSRGLALSYSGGSLGAMLTPLVITPVALWFGWRGAFLATGLIGAAWLVLWAALSRRPELRAAPEPAPHGVIHWRDPRVYAFIAAYALGALPLGYVLYGASIYLTRQFGVSQADLGRLLWIPPLGWETGYFFWGWVDDRTGRRAHRVLFLIAGALSLPLAFAGAVRSLPLLMALLFFAMFVTGAYIVGGISYATSVFGSRQAGLIAGLGAGSFSAFTAIVMPVFGRMLDRGLLAETFWLAAAFPVLGTLLWLTASGTSRAGTSGSRSHT